MGKFRTKVKSQTKGKRWPKGQSSSSNPETRKHRDLAQSRFFQENLGSSSLTYDALRRHDAVQSFSTQANPEPLQMEEDIESVGLSSTYQSTKSFASEWSGCDNMSFNHFMNSFKSDSSLHKQMLAILAAITEVLKQNNGLETPTEYYCALLTTLDQVYNVDNKVEIQITAVLSLLNMGIKAVPEAVLRRQFNEVSSKMLHILKDYVNADNNTIFKSIFGILTTLFKKQELAIWMHDSSKQIFASILNPFSIHSKPKWRKSAQEAIMLIVKSDYFTGNNVAAEMVAEFCEETLNKCMGGSDGVVPVASVQTGQTTILHILALMKDTICHFPKSHIKKCGEIILRLMTLNYPLVTSCSLQVFHALFSSQSAVVTAKLNSQLISALYEYQPAATDVQPTLAWLAVMQQAHVHLADVDLTVACTAMPKIFATITQLWLSDKHDVMTNATHALKVLLEDAIAPACETIEFVQQHGSKISKCFDTIESGLSYQFNNVWPQVLHLMGVMFEVGGRNCSHMLLGCLRHLAELRDSYKFSYNNELHHALGAAVRSMGPQIVLNEISLKKPNGDMNLDRSWMLAILKENIKGSTIEYFVKGMLPLAIYCQRKAIELAQVNDGIGAHSSELLYLQLWSLLPCFCTHPTDIKENFKTIAKILGTSISDKKDLRLAIMASLRKLIASAKQSENQDDIAEIARFDKNFLPILFNVYTTKPIGTDEEGQRLSALDTIKIYLSISNPTLTNLLLQNCIERLNTKSDDPEDPFIQESVLDLIRVLVPYQNLDNVELLYDQCVKSLPEITNKKEQKKAYRILEEICSSESEACKNFIRNRRKEVQSLLKKSLNTAVVSSKGARLKCSNYLIKSQPQLNHDSKLIRAVIPEAVLSCKDVNEKTRAIAYEVLNSIGEILLSHDEIDKFIEIIMAGLAGNAQLMTCSVLVLASVLHNFSGGLGQDNIQLILDNVVILMKSATREVVGSCLSFIKIYYKALPRPMVAASLPLIVKALTGMTDDCKRHFRLKIRDILDRLVRKFGCEYITPHVPASDTIMHKRLRNLRKLNNRKERKNKAQKEREQDSSDEEFVVKARPKSVDDILADLDSASDNDEMETDQSKISKNKKQLNTYIKEDADHIIDFTDLNDFCNITATKPTLPSTQVIDKKVKGKDCGFKTDEDGRLIIKDNKSKESDGDSDTSDSDDDDDEDDSDAKTFVLSDRKRKRTPSSVKSGASGYSQPPMKYKTGGVGIHRSTKSSASSVHSAGSEFRSKKAKGDVKRKGKLDPYAYLPFDRSSINKRKKKKAAGQFKNIVKAAKSGALKGAKAKRNKN